MAVTFIILGYDNYLCIKKNAQVFICFLVLL
jgi:hypothetical protein